MPDETVPPHIDDYGRASTPAEPPPTDQPWYAPPVPTSVDGNQGASPWSPPPAQGPAGPPPTWAPAPSAREPWSAPTTQWASPASPPPPIPPGASPDGRGRGPGGRTPRRRTGLIVLAAVVALLIGAGGVAVGAVVARDRDSAIGSAAGPVAATPVTTAVPPLKGDETEPAEAVAKVLGPAVVQIETGTGLGSGFVYDKSGLILTASHVTDKADRVQVRLSDGTKVEGRVLGEDPSTDVAVVKIDPIDGMAVAILATGVPTQVGQTAIAIGSPFGLDQTVTAGIVSAVGRPVQTPGGVIPAVQTDAPINSGNSGGALADRQGRVIGINDSIVTGSSSRAGGNTGNVGVGFAIPIDIAKAVADKLVAGESPEAGFLGIKGADATGSRPGAAVTSVEAGSPADAAGLTAEDVVTAIDGRPVTSMVDLAAAIRTNAPGEKLTLAVRRGTKERTVEVTLGKAPAN